jgi:hypothetical protein
MKNLLFTILICLLFNSNIFCQNEKKRNWSVEFGVVKSYITSEMNIPTSDLEHKAKLNNRLLLPSLRLSRNIKIKESRFSVKPFLGLSVIGASRGTIDNKSFQLDTTTYFFSTQTAFRMYYSELGSFVNYSIRNFDFQFGIKGQYALIYYSTLTLDLVPQRVRLAPTPAADSRELSYEGDRLANFSANAGFRVQYNWRRFTIATEYWQGLTDLSSARGDWFTNDVYENNLRFMVGYRF